MSLQDEARVLPDPSGDMIQGYCAEARQLIGQSGTREEALKVKEDLCSRFAAACGSSLVLQATTVYIDDLIERTWRSS